jgi:hypothetical protein
MYTIELDVHPHSNLQDNFQDLEKEEITPWLAHMKLFGFDVYVHVPKAYKTKLDAKS